MTKQEAHELLNARRRGQPFLPSEIDKALFLTGDLGTDALGFSNRVGEPLQEEVSGGWQSKSNDLVEQPSRYYGSQAWFDLHYGLKKAHE